MTAVWAVTAQSIMVAIGYATASLAAGAFATVALLDLSPADLADADVVRLTEAALVLLSSALGVFVGAFWPAMLAVAVTEAYRLRGPVQHIAAGALVGLVEALPTDAILRAGPVPPVDGTLVQVALASGAVGGLVYWAIAGRTAGRWLELRWFAPRGH